VLIPMAFAGILAGLVIGLFRLEWCWAIPVAGFCLVAVFAAMIWWEGRS
jgi:hypothetical protein